MIDGASIIFNSEVLISLCGELAKHLSLLRVVAVTRPAPYLWEQQGPRSEVTESQSEAGSGLHLHIHVRRTNNA